MNFQTGQPFDHKLSKLLAIIILYEKKIQELKKKLAGNQQFHTRLIFQKIDYRKKGQITPQDLIYSLASQNHNFSLPSCQALCRKYTISGAISYEELLALITPKTDKALAQRLMLRTVKRGSILPQYLWKYFCQMFSMLISMTVITQQIRKNIQNCSELNHLQMIQFFRRVLKSQQAIWRFCNNNSQEQYDFQPKDIKYLSNNIRSGNQLSEMTDQDIKQLICPLDMNFQKTINQMAQYYQNIKIQKYKTQNGAFYQQTKSDQQARNRATVNFLNTDYRSMYPNVKKIKQNMNTNNYHNNINIHTNKTYLNNNYNNYIPAQRQSININRPKYEPQANDMLLKPSRVIQGTNMYLDNFIKPIPSYQTDRHSMQLDKYLSQRYNKNINSNINVNMKGKGGYQRFQDNLPQNLDSQQSNSAFVQY